MTSIQIPGIILPRAAPLGTETEIILDALNHVSNEIYVQYLDNISVSVSAVEVVLAGIPANLNLQIQVSPYPSVNNTMWPAPLPATTLYWANVGGAVPVAGTGVNNTVHTAILNWNTHGVWARLVAYQTAPVVATAFWAVQAILMGRGG